MKQLILIVLAFSIGVAAHAQLYGINMVAPFRGKLEVQGAVDRTVAIFGGESSGISVQKGTPAIGYNSYYNGNNRFIGDGYAAVQYVNQDFGTMGFDIFGYGTTNNLCPAPKRILTLNPIGSIIIGTNNYNAALSVDRNPGVESTAFIYGTTHHTAFNFGQQENTYIRAGRDLGTVIFNDIPKGKTVLTGPVGINATNPVFPLEVNQLPNKGIALVDPVNFNYWEWWVSTSNSFLQFKYNGFQKGQFNYSNGTYSMVSDLRLKHDIVPIPSVIDNVMKLRPVEYEVKFNNPQHDRTIGFIAQEVKELVPAAVSVSTNTEHQNQEIPDFHTINYNVIGVTAVKAVQEQQSQLQNQFERLKMIEEKLEELSRKLPARK